MASPSLASPRRLGDLGGTPPDPARPPPTKLLRIGSRDATPHLLFDNHRCRWRLAWYPRLRPKSNCLRCLLPQPIPLRRQEPLVEDAAPPHLTAVHHSYRIHQLRSRRDGFIGSYVVMKSKPVSPPTGALQLRKCIVTMVHFKNRYMVVEVFIDAARGEKDPIILTQFNITQVIRDSIQLNFGECGLAGSLGSLQVKYVNPVTKLCIVRVSREDHQKVWAAMTMVRCIGKIPVSFNLLDMSGSIRACKKAVMECDEAKFEQYKVAAGDRITAEIIQSVESCFEKIRGLES
ncbi:unnamed protein product [Miscanthus lutarioriparius]|uniref:Uncharacterized protein n=1 Tax=Miscanthus lutarioriparius TaxID=422564 RepID=A0A811QDF1_9POAL|nr:unnamed protein product [Miscanthus lutarioriparius]